MKRKIIEQGLTKTKVITLPIKWARKYGLGKGDEIDLEIQGPKIIITSPKTAGIKETITLQQELLKPYEERILGKLYIAGYDNMELTDITDTKSLKNAKKEIQEKLLGLAIIEETKSKIVFETIVTETKEQYDNYAQKVFQTAIQYAKEVREAITTGNYQNLDDIQNIEKTNGRFAGYCERYLNKTGHKNYAFDYIILWSMEKIADEYKYLLGHASKHNIKASKELLAYYDKTVAFIESTHKLYNKFDMDSLSKIIKQKSKLTEEGEDLLKKKKKYSHTIY